MRLALPSAQACVRRVHPSCINCEPFRIHETLRHRLSLSTRRNAHARGMQCTVCVCAQRCLLRCARCILAHTQQCTSCALLFVCTALLHSAGDETPVTAYLLTTQRNSNFFCARKLAQKHTHRPHGRPTELGELEQPWGCPHGRPTMRHVTNLDTARD